MVVIPAAQNDAEEAIAYYRNINERLAINFLKTLENLYHKLQDQPYNYSFFDTVKQLRSISFLKFPYPIIFQIIDDSVYIYAIRNTHQNPQNILNRI